MLPNWATVTRGIAGFFEPNPLAFLGMHVPLAPERAAYYSTEPLERDAGRAGRFRRVCNGAHRA